MLVVRIRASYWTIKHAYQYSVINQNPPCHLCHVSVGNLDEHLLFHLSYVHQFVQFIKTLEPHPTEPHLPRMAWCRI